MAFYYGELLLPVLEKHMIHHYGRQYNLFFQLHAAILWPFLLIPVFSIYNQWDYLQFF